MTNPPAFPISTGDAVISQGMTLRDYFAAAALSGWLSNVDILDAIDRIEDGSKAKAQIARTVFSIADALLAERQKTK